jgi:antitoxin MazE
VKVAKWGNSLAVRLPRPVVEAGPGGLEVSRDRSREEARAQIRAMRVPLPPDYKSDREEANARGGFKVDPDMVDGR